MSLHELFINDLLFFILQNFFLYLYQSAFLSLYLLVLFSYFWPFASYLFPYLSISSLLWAVCPCFSQIKPSYLVYTLCPRSLGPIFIVSYCIKFKCVKTYIQCLWLELSWIIGQWMVFRMVFDKSINGRSEVHQIQLYGLFPCGNLPLTLIVFFDFFWGGGKISRVTKI